MILRQQINKMILETFKSGAVPHIGDMCEEIQDYMIRRSRGENVHNSKFVESCAKEDWDRANSIADNINKEALTTNFYQNFVRLVSMSDEIRDIKIDKILSGNQRDII